MLVFSLAVWYNIAMKAYRIHSIRQVSLDEMDAQPVGENCVKLKNLMIGVTSSDVMLYTGRISAEFPVIPSRQCVGFVSETGAEVSGISRGDRVVTYPQASCHNCAACKDGRYTDCESPSMFGLTEDGFLSDFSVVSADDVYVIPDRLKDEEGVYVEHTAMAINIISKLKINKGEHIIIVGATSIGIILAQVAMYYQAVPIVVDMREDMLAVAQSAGVYYTINPVTEDVNKKVLAITGGHMADACAYILSTAMPLQNVFDYTAIGGRVALGGRLDRNELKCNLNGLVEKKLDLVTVTDCGKFYSSAINMLANHTVNVDILPKRIIGFADVPQAFESVAGDHDDGVKILIKV